MVYDITTFNGERELFDLRYNILKDVVDEFIVIEFDQTFSGESKKFSEDTVMFFWKYDKVTYHFHTKEIYEKYREMAELSPNTAGADHWKLEFMQKESIKDAVSHAKDEDILFIGDVDEMWSPIEPMLRPGFELAGSLKLKLRVYSYYLNNRSTEDFHGTIRTTYGYIKDKCLNHVRSFYGKSHGIPKTNPEAPQEYYDSSATYTEPLGWHFTSMGGAEKLTKKLTDSYTQDSYATPQVLENVAYNIEQSKDFLGRNFTYTLDESEWPSYLTENREKYKHLIK